MAFNSGHGGDAVENVINLGPGEGGKRSFNSDTAVMPWKITILGWDGCTDTKCLQFGHGGDAVENDLQVFLLSQSIRAFNSATAVMPWKI